MGSDATEADFQRWVAFVCCYGAMAFGEEIDVDALPPGGVQETVIRGADLYERNAIRDGIQHLWYEFCARRVPAVKPKAELPGAPGAAHVDTRDGADDEGPFVVEYPESAERS